MAISKNNYSKEEHEDGQIIKTPHLDGPAQMASDIFMLEKLSNELKLSIAFRCYRWKGVWLSIGHNQKVLPQHWIKLVKDKKLNIVRRPSGGSAVLHSGGITYSLVWKSPPRKKHQAYIEATKWLISCFEDIGVSLNFGNESNSILNQNCFTSSTHADLVDQQGIKRIGNAQYWRKGSLLQHGEILLDPPKKIWEEVFNENPPKEASRKIPRKRLEDLLTKALIAHWPKVNWRKQSLSEYELKEIFQKSKDYMVNFSNSDF